MREKRNVAWGQSAPVVAAAAALWVTGVVALPLIFGGPAGTGVGLPWLGVAAAGLGGLGGARLVPLFFLPPAPDPSPVVSFGVVRLSAAPASPASPPVPPLSTPPV